MPGGRSCWLSTRAARTSWTQADAWKQVAAAPAALPAVNPAVDTYATAGHLSVALDRRDHPRAAW